MPHIEIEIRYLQLIEREHLRERARTPQLPSRMVRTLGGKPGTCVFYDLPQRVVDVLDKRRIPFQSLKAATLNHGRDTASGNDRKAVSSELNNGRDAGFNVLSLSFQPGR